MISAEKIDPPMLAEKIADLCLSARAENCLYSLNIETVAQLVAKSAQDLRRAKNFGLKSLREVEAALSEFGLKLSDDHHGPCACDACRLQRRIAKLNTENVRLKKELADMRRSRDAIRRHLVQVLAAGASKFDGPVGSARTSV